MKGHKYGIDKIQFFKDDKYLISVGDKEDKSINMWSVNNPGEIMFNSKYNRPIIGFDICDDYLVLTGVQFIKIWTIDMIENNAGQEKFVVNKINVETGKLKDKVFTAAVIYFQRILLLTSDAHLAELKYDTKQIARWMHLKVYNI